MIDESLKWVKGSSSLYIGALASCVLLSVVLVIMLEIRSRAMKAKTKPKDCMFGASLHWALSPPAGRLNIEPKEERFDIGKHDPEGDGEVQSEVFHSVKSCFSRCSSENELDCFSHNHGESIWDGFTECQGWPFGLCRKSVVLPPLPRSPSDSWTWHKKNLGTKVCAST